MSVNIAQRIREHKSKARAHIPEPLALVRFYSAGGRNVDQAERAFHRLLHTAGLDNPRRAERQVGTE